MHGEGEFNWVDGRKYRGWYFENKRYGMGTYYWPDGRKYIGFWKDGVMHGKGILVENGE